MNYFYPGTPQYPVWPQYGPQYYHQYGYTPDPKRYEKKAICSAALRSAFAIVAAIALQIAVYFVLILLTNFIYLSVPLFKSAVDDIVQFRELILQLIECATYAIAMLPFVFLALFARKFTGRTYKSIFSIRNVNASLAAPLVLVGIAGSLIASIASSFFMAVLHIFNIQPPVPNMAPPSSWPAQILFVIFVSVFPAIMEEFAFRGVILSIFRKFGDGYAIFISSLLFALFHGNLMQAPFAFILGLIFGYIVVTTGSVWITVLAHFLNNLFAALFNIISENVSRYTINLINIGYFLVVLVLGFIALVYILAKHKNMFSMMPSNSALTFKQRVASSLPGVLILSATFILLNIIALTVR